MRRLEFLISEVRNSTDNKDVNGIATSEIISYYNSAQKYITSLIFKNNPYCDLFKSQSVQPSNTSNTYTLPANCFAVNAISMIEVRTNTSNINNGYVRVKPISESEFAHSFGYITRDGLILISGQDSQAWYTDIRITYFKQLPTLDIRRGQVTSPYTATTFTVTPFDSNMLEMGDVYSLCDAKGVQTVKEIYSSSQTSPMTSTAAKVTEIQAASPAGECFLLSGIDACNMSLLPDVCETYLQDYVRQRIYTRNNYDDANKQMYFTEQQKLEIISIFSKNKKDDDNIPTTDTEFLLW